MISRFLVPILALGAITPCLTQTTPESQLMAEIKNGKAMDDLEYLSDDIGARLTGSESAAKAEDWMAAKMKEYGGENVHFESYDYASRWVRGKDDYAQLLTQSGRQMEVHAMPWNPSTHGMIEADLALASGPIDDLVKNLDSFKGKIVVLGPIPPNDEQKLKLFNKGLGTRAKAILVSMEHGDAKFTTYGSPYDSYFDDYFGGWPRVPFGFLTAEDRSMLVRLLRKGETVRMKLRLGGEITKRNIKERNVVCEIRGTEKPDEVVIVGGHLDSWDLGTGTTDNGTGAVATLETLRAMKKLGLKPLRTIRFITFTGEEQGSIGAHAYVAAHKAEFPSVQAVVIDDLGAGKPDGFTVQGYSEWIPALKNAMAPLESLGVTKVLVQQHWDSDQDPFVFEGVPGFFMNQDITDYFASTHHSQTDMFNHVKSADYLASIQSFAIAAWEFANMSDRVPHVKPGNLVGPSE
jgi:carboxypeptidase Q